MKSRCLSSPLAPLPLGKLSRHIALAALCLATPLAAPRAEAADTWARQTVPGSQVPYVKLDDLRGIYKFAPDTQDRKKQTRQVSNGRTTLIFGPDPHALSIHGVNCRLSHPTCTNERGEFLISLTDVVKLIDPVLRPTYIAERREVKTVVIDPGHGGQDVGIQTAEIREADFTASLARMLATQLNQRGYQNIITRTGTGNLSHHRRIDLANRESNAIFLSLHLNSGRRDIHGIETYTVAPFSPPVAAEPQAETGQEAAPPTPSGAESPASPTGAPAAPGAAPAEPAAQASHQPQDNAEGARPGNRQDGANIALAFALQSSLVHATGAQDGGCRRARYSLLSSIYCPAAIVELGYATHKQEAEGLNSEEYRALLATALADGVDAFARAIKPGAKPPVTAAPPPPEPPTPVKVDKITPDDGKKKADSGKSSSKGSKKKSGSSKTKTIRKSKERSRSRSRSGKRTGRKR